MTRDKLVLPHDEHFEAKGAEISLIKKDSLLWQL
jgi:hypothetical protein